MFAADLGERGAAVGSVSWDFELSPVEARLREAFERCEPLELGGETVRAEVLAHLVTAPREEGQRRSLELSGALITGDLGLSDCTAPVPVVLRDCRFDGEILLNDTRAARIHLEDCEVGAIHAARLRCEGPLWLCGLREVVFVDLEDARIAGDLVMVESRIHNGNNAVDLMGAKIDGDFNATGIDLAGTLFMAGAVVTGFFVLSEAKLSNPDGMTVFAKAASIGLDVVAESMHSDGELHFSGARVGGDFQLMKAEIKKPGDCALSLLSAEVRGSVYAWKGFCCDGSLDIRHATISGQLRFDEANISQPSEIAIFLDWSEVAGGVEALERVEVMGAVNLVGTRIGGAFRFCNAELHGRRDFAINAFGASFGTGFRLESGTRVTEKVSLGNCTISGDVILDKIDAVAVNLANCTVSGDVMLDKIDAVAVNLANCTVSGHVSFTAGKLTNSGAKALGIGNCDISGDVFLGEMHVVGGLRMTGNKVGGDLALRGSSLTGPGRGEYVGYFADTTVGGTLWAHEGFKCSGALRMVNLVAPFVTFHGAELTAPGDVALNCSNLKLDDLALTDVTVDGGVAVVSSAIGHVLRFMSASVTGGARKTDPEEVGSFALDLVGTTVGRRLNLTGSRFDHKVILTDASVGQDIRLDDAVLGGTGGCALDGARLTAAVLRLLPAAVPNGSVHLANAKVELLLDRADAWPRGPKIDLAGFSYARLGSGMTLHERLAWLEAATPQLEPGPYEQLATCLTAAGNDDDARMVRLAAIRRSYKERGARKPAERLLPRLLDWLGYLFRRLWGALQDSVLGYGYRPMRAVMLFVVMWLAGGAAFALGSGPCLRSGIPEPGPCPVKLDEHPTWDAFLYALDLLIPLIDLGHEKAWDVVGPSKAVMWLLTVSGWVLATAIISAASRTLRRNW
ncbi:hypothetical protein AB0L13_04255 [Saccharopolyspora shandongensis]|uniref:hypothetical protein n=1 Tax=Saccharopolyspora shandongensis TaxID=418495 RepID=UPI0034175676